MRTSLMWFSALILVIGSALLFGSQRPAAADFADRSVSDLAKYVQYGAAVAQGAALHCRAGGGGEAPPGASCRGGPLDMLVGGAPSVVLAWLKRKSELADNTQPGLPIATPEVLFGILALAETRGPPLILKPGRKARSSWPILKVGLLRARARITSGFEGCRIPPSRVARLLKPVRLRRPRALLDGRISALGPANLFLREP